MVAAESVRFRGHRPKPRAPDSRTSVAAADDFLAGYVLDRSVTTANCNHASAVRLPHIGQRHSRSRSLCKPSKFGALTRMRISVTRQLDAVQLSATSSNSLPDTGSGAPFDGGSDSSATVISSAGFCKKTAASTVPRCPHCGCPLPPAFPPDGACPSCGARHAQRAGQTATMGLHNLQAATTRGRLQSRRPQRGCRACATRTGVETLEPVNPWRRHEMSERTITVNSDSYALLGPSRCRSCRTAREIATGPPIWSSRLDGTRGDDGNEPS